MLKYRIITALIGIPILFSVIWFLPSLYFALITALAVAFAAWEWTRLMGFTVKYLQYVYVLVTLLGLYFVKALPILPVLVVGLLMWVWAGFAVLCFNKGKKPLGFQLPEVQAIVGFFILAMCWLAFVNLRLGAGEFGPIRLMLGLLIVFATDTGAYFSGRLWGKRALASRVSPKKTWEGFWGGLVLALLVSMGFTFFFPMSLEQRLAFWAIALVVAVFSVIGDLTVSMLKRQVGLKNSGQLLPGHGGLWDRADSVVSGILVFALGLMLFGV